jgi:hypothetical protein
MNQWVELCQIASNIQFAIIKQIYTHITWKICVPPRIHILLWLLTNNKVLTRDNLAKRRLKDKTCLFCTETELVTHQFFDCCVAKYTWGVIPDIMDLPLIRKFETMANWWLSEKN